MRVTSADLIIKVPTKRMMVSQVASPRGQKPFMFAPLAAKTPRQMLRPHTLMVATRKVMELACYTPGFVMDIH